MIGDPSGRSAERNLQSPEQIEANVASIRPQLERFLDFSGPRGAIMGNNAEWLESVRLLDFLRDVGKHFTIPYMLAKDSVQVRLEAGLSFTEFSYMLIQALDFQHLHQALECELQMGGADQWGNITAGLELIRRTSPPRPDGAPNAFAMAYPLLLAPSGTKFGSVADLHVVGVLQRVLDRVQEVVHDFPRAPLGDVEIVPDRGDNVLFSGER